LVSDKESIECLCDKCPDEVPDENTFVKLLAVLKPEELHTALLVLETSKHCLCNQRRPRKYWLGAVQDYKATVMMRKCQSLRERDKA
jgi:hypothetical protein